MSKSICSELLKRRIASLEKTNGINHWESAVYHGILDNDKVLNWISIP